MDKVTFWIFTLALWWVIHLGNRFILTEGVRNYLANQFPIRFLKPKYQKIILGKLWQPLLAITLVSAAPGFVVDSSDKACFPESPAFLSLPESGQDWLDFRSRKLSFVGRSKELDELDKFLNTNTQFSWWWLNGAAGTGKSRLALEWSALHSNWYLPCSSRGYDIGLFRDIGGEDLWRFWQPRRPTVIVIDDAAEHTNRILVLLRDLGQRAKELDHPVRVLLVERAIPEHLKQLDEKILYSENRYRQDSLKLSPLGPDDLEMLGKEVALLRGRTLNWTDELKKQILKISQGKPLFMILAIDNLLENNGAISWKGSEDILEVQTARTRAKLLQAGLPEACVPLVAMATLTRRLRWETAKLFAPDSACENKLLFDRLYQQDTTQYIPALEPDLLGEYFVLKEFSNLTEPRQKFFLNIAWDASPKEVAETLYKVGGDFKDQFVTSGIDRMPRTSEQLAWWGRIRVWLLSKENLSEADIRLYWAQLSQLAQDYQSDSLVNLAVMQGGAWAIRNFGNLQISEDMHKVQEKLEAISNHFERDSQIQAGLLMGLAHAVGHYGKSKLYSEMKRAFERIESTARRFANEVDIQTMLAMGTTNVIDDYDRSPYSDEVPRLFELVKSLAQQFPENASIQYLTLYSISPSISAFARRQSWSDVESSLSLASTIAGRFKDKPEFQLGLVGALNNAINSYGNGHLLDKTIAPLEILKEVGSRFAHNQEIQQIVSKGLHNAIAAYQDQPYANKSVALFAYLREISDRFPNNSEVQYYLSNAALNVIHVLIERHEGEKVEELYKYVTTKGDIFAEHKGIQLNLCILTANKLNYYIDLRQLDKFELHLEFIRAKTKKFPSDPGFQEALASALVTALQAYGNDHRVVAMEQNLNSLRAIVEKLPEDIKIQQILAIGLHKAAWVYRVQGYNEQMNRAREELQAKFDHFPNDNEIAGWWALLLSQSLQAADKNAEESYHKLKELSLRYTA